MAKKSKTFGVNNFIKRKPKKRPKQHSKSPNKKVTKKKSRGQGKP